MRKTASILNWWQSKKLTEKFSVLFITLILIGLLEFIISFAALDIVEDTAIASQTSLKVQRLSLEMSRDWEIMQHQQYRFFSEYPEIGFLEAKQLYAIPAGESLANIIRVGAGLRRMTSAPGASENLRNNDLIMQQYLADVAAYANGLETAVHLASEENKETEKRIQDELVHLEKLTQSIEPAFPRLILMAQYEVVFAQDQIKKTRQRVGLLLALANIFGILLTGLIIFGFNKNITAKVARLTTASGKIQQGLMQERVKIVSADEFGLIADAFNSMADSIEDRTQSLQESETRYRELVTSSPYFVTVQQDGRFAYVNPAFEESLGYEQDELIGIDVLIVVHDEDRVLIELQMEQFMKASSPESVEFRMIDKQGKILFVETVSVPIQYNNKPAVLGFGQDITGRKKMEKSMLESEKLAGIGTLAAGMAHEINTPLQVISGYAESLQRDIEEGDLPRIESLDRKIEVIHRNAWRIAGIVRSLLDYARSTTEKAVESSINDIITKALLMIEHQFISWSNITVTTDLTENLPMILCDPAKVTQVLINLLNNARDAMADGGWINISTAYDESKKCILLRISDTGEGISEDLRSSIFDPFFTTKPVGDGTGLGLSISAGIVRAHGGSLELESSSKAGSVFLVTLPAGSAYQQIDLEVSSGRY